MRQFIFQPEKKWLRKNLLRGHKYELIFAGGWSSLNTWGMLCKWTPMGQIFQISKHPDILSFVIIPRMFWKNLTKIGHIHISYKFSQSGCIPPKIKWEILAHKGSQTTRATPGDYLASWNRKPIRQGDFLASMTMHQDFPGKMTHCRHVLLKLILA